MKTAIQRWACAPLLAVMTAGLLAGCGGGGGGTIPITPVPGPTQPSTASITGVLQDKATGTLLSGRTVTVQGTGLAGVTDGNGAFSIANVPLSSVTLVIIDAAGASDGFYSVDVSQVSGNPRNLGVIQLAVSTGGPPAPPIS